MTDRTQQPIYVRPKDAEKMFGVSRTTFHRWLKEAGPAITSRKCGNIRLIRREDLENWLEARGQ
ncbi:hypothetical protein DSD19_04750 [Rhodovulum sp. BSW8]|uniref:helix-turn-helix domain-containing protein n=1 Tax=Rhodovulum sp. BSW8 TaxID=2259645 RepID=UPI000DE4ADB2|nr:helix-turn-helix domain-containing protein [Rhodovulum sp. BSW8]RBO54689.1 hypothetical protein DSD19_04750 [Rhodovulum sp. BSW8]